MSYKSANQLGLPSGNAVMRDGQVTVLPPGHSLDGHRQTDVGPCPIPQMTPAAQSQVILKTTYQDRAQGYRTAVQPLSLTMGLLSVIVATVGAGVPVFSLSVLAWFGTAYAITWLLGYLVHAFVSPDGATILHALLGYRIIRQEQKFRNERYRNVSN